MAAFAGTHWGTVFQTYTAQNTQYSEFTATDLSSPSGGVAAGGPSMVGSGATTNEPALACVRVKFNINRRYRGGHPAVYMPGPGQAHMVSPTTWDATVLTNIANGWGTWVTSMVGGISGGPAITNQVNVSYYQGFTSVQLPNGRWVNKPKPRPVPETDIINSWTTEQTISTQRRRGGL
jgi:hypothetical protein